MAFDPASLAALSGIAGGGTKQKTNVNTNVNSQNTLGVSLSVVNTAGEGSASGSSGSVSPSVTAPSQTAQNIPSDPFLSQLSPTTSFAGAKQAIADSGFMGSNTMLWAAGALAAVVVVIAIVLPKRRRKGRK